MEENNNPNISTNPNRSRRVQKEQEQPRYGDINKIPVPTFNEPERATFERDIPVTTNKTARHEPVEGTEVAPIEEPAPIEVKPTVLNIKDVASLLKDSTSGGFYTIKFNSINKEYSFKQLTVGQQRSISKNSADFENGADQIKLRLGILKAICLDPDFDPMQIDYMDFVKALLIVRNENFVDPIQLTVPCKGDACEAKCPVEIDLNEIIEKLEGISVRVAETKPTFEFDVGKNHVRFELSSSKMDAFYAMTKYMSIKVKAEAKKKKAQGMTQEEIEQSMRMNMDDLGLVMYTFINKIFINDIPVEITDIKLDPSNFMKFIDENFISMDFRKFASVIDENFSEFSEKIWKHEFECPVCHHINTLELDLDSFFM